MLKNKNTFDSNGTNQKKTKEKKDTIERIKMEKRKKTHPSDYLKKLGKGSIFSFFGELKI